MRKIIWTPETIEDNLVKITAAPMMDGVIQQQPTGKPDYGDDGDWYLNNAQYIRPVYESPTDPGIGECQVYSYLKYRAYSNFTYGATHGRYLTGKHIKGISFEWRTYPRVNLSFRKWGYSLRSPAGLSKRWSSEDVADDGTFGSQYKIITHDFPPQLQSLLNSGWHFDQFHTRVSTFDYSTTPSKNSVFAVRKFKFIYQDSKFIVPSYRPLVDMNKEIYFD